MQQRSVANGTRLLDPETHPALQGSLYPGPIPKPVESDPRDPEKQAHRSHNPEKIHQWGRSDGRPWRD
jgi:hypothetical protein